MSEREIAEDVMQAATAAWQCADNREDRGEGSIVEVAYAIQAERERCAKIADGFPDTTNHPAGPLYGAGFAAAVQMMRLAIRQGSPK